jgi:pSer/pThr/pTyr-binding forkhead associated (FHA) protein
MSTTIHQPTAGERFSKSIGGTLKSIVNAGSRTYFILEHKSNTEKHPMGQSAPFIGDYIELGRGNKYAVNFGEDCPTVSRPHAAIIRKSNGWVVKPLSRTNPTLVNGVRIADETPLHNGDEIQLSLNGPRLSFLTPANNKVGTMGMTIRMKAFMKEAVRPYRTALSLITVAFLLIIGGLVYYGQQRNTYYSKLFQDQQVINQHLADSLKRANNENASINHRLVQLTKALEKVEKAGAGNSTGAGNGDPSASSGSSALRSLMPNIYYILTDRAVYTIGNETKEVEFKISGTGFLLSDGRFVTARHVVNPWSFVRFSGDDEGNKTELLLNLVASNGGKVVLYMTAFSPDGSRISLTSDDFTLDDSQDEKKSKTDEEGNTYVFSLASLKGGSDWAYAKTNLRGRIEYDGQASTKLEAATRLHVLGYSLGIGVNGASDIKPTYNECQVSRDGLDNGVIDISGRGFDQGNSGGPAFIVTGDRYIAVGIISAEVGNQGFLTPINSIR